MCEAYDIGLEVVQMLREGKHHEATKRFYDNNVVSIKAAEMPNRTKRGLQAVLSESENVTMTMQVESASFEGPFPSYDDFAIYFDMHLTERTSGNKRHMKEVGIYKVAGGKIVHERFFYHLG